MTDKEKQMIINFGALGYAPKMCAIILGWELTEFEKHYNDHQSELYKAYEAGAIKSEYVIDLKLFEQAQQGDIKSLDKLNQRKLRRK